MNQNIMKASSKLVKNLKAKIKLLEKDRDYYKSNYYEKETEVGKKDEIIKTFESLRNIAVGGRTEALEQEIKHLKEIIKWLIKPSTTKDKKPEDFPHFSSGKGY